MRWNHVTLALAVIASASPMINAESSSEESSSSVTQTQQTPSEPDYSERIKQRQNPNTSIAYESIDNVAPPYQERWSDFLPLLGKEAKEQGYVLPRPFGLSVIGFHQKQPFDVTNIGLKINNQSPDLINEIISNTVTATDLTVTDTTLNLRADAWLLPFFNVYALAGRSDIKAKLQLNVDASIPASGGPTLCNALNLPYQETQPGTILPPKPSEGECLIQQSAPVTLDIEGDNLGVGFTIAGGYGDFFGMLDMNYTESDLDIATDKAKTTVISTRLGWNGAFGNYGGSLWIGAMHQDVKQTLNIPIQGSGIAAVIEQEGSAPLNYLLGGRWNFSEAWEVILETNAGFAERQQFMMQLSYRM